MHSSLGAPLVFKEIMLSAYAEKLLGPMPRFPAEMEQRIDVYLKGDPVETTVVRNINGKASGIGAGEVGYKYPSGVSPRMSRDEASSRRKTS